MTRHELHLRWLCVVWSCILTRRVSRDEMRFVWFGEGNWPYE